MHLKVDEVIKAMETYFDESPKQETTIQDLIARKVKRNQPNNDY
jgi:hypothetical protein